VKILKAGGVVVTVQTGEDGKFDFPSLDPGKYEIKIEATGFVTAWSPIVVKQPDTTCKKMLRVQLALPSVFGCPPNIQIFKK
jgi:hypothetical protein